MISANSLLRIPRLKSLSARILVVLVWFAPMSALHAQLPENFALIQESRIYSVRYSTLDSFDDIPPEVLLRSVYGQFSHYDTHPELTADDLETIRLAAEFRPDNSSYRQLLSETCAWYQTQQDTGQSVSSSYVAEQMVRLHSYDREDNRLVMEEAFELLSPSGQQLLLDEIESMRGTGRLGGTHLDMARLADERPDIALALFQQSCSSLPLREPAETQRTQTIVVPFQNQDILWRLESSNYGSRSGGDSSGSTTQSTGAGDDMQ